MKRILSIRMLLAGALTWAAWASGSYLPAGVRPKDDSLSFNLGQAIYTGDIRIGPGQTCAGCLPPEGRSSAGC